VWLCGRGLCCVLLCRRREREKRTGIDDHFRRDSRGGGGGGASVIISTSSLDSMAYGNNRIPPSPFDDSGCGELRGESNSPSLTGRGRRTEGVRPSYMLIFTLIDDGVKLRSCHGGRAAALVVLWWSWGCRLMVRNHGGSAAVA
jgi:hypothetical protein